MASLTPTVLEPATPPTLALLQVDRTGRVVDATESAGDLFSRSPLDEWLGGDDREAVAAVVRRVLAGELGQASLQVYGPSGVPVWLTFYADPDAPGVAVARARPGRRAGSPDARAQVDRLRLLTAVTSHGGGSFRERLRRALRLTSELLGLELAIVSQIEGETYTVYEAYSPAGALAAGDQFALGDTFCSITLDAPDVFAVNEIGSSPHRVHPCYRVFELESYVGACVVVRDKRWGTITFSSKTPLDEPLTPADHDLIRLLAHWTGGEIEREQDRRALAESERRYRALAQATFEGIAFSDGGVVTDCNPQFARLLGYGSVADVVGRPASDLVAPDSLEKVSAMIAAGRQDPYEAGLRRADGSTFWAEIQGQMQTLDGETVRVTAVRDVSERRELSERLEHQATHDALTGLPNRTLFYARIEAAIRAGAAFSVLFVDLDRFKVVNDSLGHEMGDFLLATVAERLRAALGPIEGATIARLGGDEFGVVVPLADGPATSGRRVARTILASLAAPVDLGLREHEPGASVGVVENAERYRTPEDVIRDADTAMYEAKRTGRGRFAAFDTAMREEAYARFRLEHDLRRALVEDELRVYFQPIVRLDTGATVGFEALVRWAHPERGVVAPDEFLPLAEELGLIVQVDEWMVDATARALRDGLGPAQLQGEGALLWLSINCSDTTFLSRTLRERVRRAVEVSGIEPGRLVLELTERAVVDPSGALEAVGALHGEGVQVCVDDFGTGYSSLGLVSGLPVDGLKIDRSFVSGLGSSDGASAVVEAVIAMSRRLGLRVVAEGVETEAHRATLLDLGCELGQGYLFGRPVPAEEALAALRAPTDPALS